MGRKASGIVLVLSGLAVALVPPCPGNWEYTHIANNEVVLEQRSRAILISIRNAGADYQAASASDTRSMHGSLFLGLTPPHFPYYAGQYRGYFLRCLSTYEVGINGDARVGHPAATVPQEMAAFTVQIKQLVQEADFCWQVPNAILDSPSKVLRIVHLVAAAFVYFLEIHPYANGNGHMARFLLIALFARHQLYFRSNMEIHPRPREPDYSKAIASYRNGDVTGLHRLLLEAL